MPIDAPRVLIPASPRFSTRGRGTSALLSLVLMASFVPGLAPCGEDARPDSPPPLPTPPATVTGIGDLRAMPPNARRELGTLSLRGVVTWAAGGPPPNFCVIDDGTGGIFVYLPTAIDPDAAAPEPHIATGTQLEVVGTIQNPEGSIPRFTATALRILGTAPLPMARPSGASYLWAGRGLHERVQMDGVIQNVVALDPDWTELTVAKSNGEATVVLRLPPDASPDRLLGSSVLISGTIMGKKNERDQITSFYLWTDHPEDLVVRKWGRIDIGAAPEIPLDSLQLFQDKGAVRGRRRVAGIVTYCGPRNILYVQNAGHAIRIEAVESSSFDVGDRVEAAGFLQLQNGVVGMRGAVARKLGKVEPPTPMALDPTAVFAETGAHNKALTHLDGLLVRLQGRLVELQRHRAGHRLLMTSGKTFFSAELDADDGGALHRIEPGSEIAVTGIANPRPDPAFDAVAPRVTGLTVLLRAPADVAVLKAPSWWTQRRLLAALAVIAPAAAALALWSWALHRRVRRRTLALAERTFAQRSLELEREVILRERARIAGDLHDGVQQLILGLGFHLEAADAAPASMAKHLATARGIMPRIHEEFRRCVWALRQLGSAETSPAPVLEAVAEIQRRCADTQIEVNVEGDVGPLPRLIVTSLSMLAREAMTNAVRHGAAKNIRVQFKRGEDGATLTVSDDGCGFAPGLPEREHFGLAGMSARISSLGGTLDIDSQPGRGSRVTARIPSAALSKIQKADVHAPQFSNLGR